MFNTQHILYMVISGVLTAVLLLLAWKFLKKQEQKDQLLKFFAILTVLIHYSDIWVDYFTNNGQVQIASIYILPVYPCNVVMWMLLVAALMRRKERLPFQMLGEFCFYIGTLCSVLGILLNANFDNNPTLADYSILKGLLSHSTMLVGCLYMMTGGYIRVRFFNAVSVTAGLLTFVLCGIGVNRLYDHFGMEAPDGMFLRSNPYLPVSPVWPGIGAILLMFLVLGLLELRKKKKEKRKQHA